jgi:hypothetical protein
VLRIIGADEILGYFTATIQRLTSGSMMLFSPFLETTYKIRVQHLLETDYLLIIPSLFGF